MRDCNNRCLHCVVCPDFRGLLVIGKMMDDDIVITLDAQFVKA